jgi:hypothetical protein
LILAEQTHYYVENKGPLPENKPKQTQNKAGKGLGMARVADGFGGTENQRGSLQSWYRREN